MKPPLIEQAASVLLALFIGTALALVLFLGWSGGLRP